MSMIFNQLYCIFNHYLNQYVDTGSKTLDSHIIILIPLILGFIFEIIKKIYVQRTLKYYWHRYYKKTPVGFDPTSVLYKKINIDVTRVPFEYVHKFDVSQMFKFLCKEWLEQDEYIFLQSGNNMYIDLHPKHKSFNKQSKLTNFLFPIWYSKTHKEFIYISTCSVHLYTRNKLCIDEFLNYINKQDINENEFGIYTYQNGNYVNVGEINSKKTFDHIFFENKEKVMCMLNKYKNKQLYPEHFCMDNKLGILLHGPPGTGKTTFITCVANMLNKSIFMINLSNISTQEELNKIFKAYKSNKYIYVFEELDCIADVIKIRDGTDNQNENMKHEIKQIESNYLQIIANSKNEEKDKLFEKMKEEIHNIKNKLNLSYLLQKLDGIESANDRLIIATTNHPEYIDPALLRPGRFDINLKLDNCSCKIISEILSYYYQTEIKDSDIPLELDLKYAPVYIINKCLISSNINDALSELKQLL